MLCFANTVITGLLTLTQSAADFAGTYIPLTSCCQRPRSIAEAASQDSARLAIASVTSTATALCTVFFEGPIIREQLEQPLFCREVRIGGDAVPILDVEAVEEADSIAPRHCCVIALKWSSYSVFTFVTLSAWYMNSATLYAQIKGRFFSDGTMNPLESSPADLDIYDFAVISFLHLSLDAMFYLFSEIYGTIETLEYGAESSRPILTLSPCFRSMLSSNSLQNFVRIGGSISSTVVYVLPVIFWIVPESWDFAASLSLSISAGVLLGIPKFASALMFYGHKCVENMLKLAERNPAEVELPFDLNNQVFWFLYYSLFLEGPMHAIDIATTFKGGLALTGLSEEHILWATVAVGLLTLPGASLAKVRDAQDSLIETKQRRDARIRRLADVNGEDGPDMESSP